MAGAGGETHRHQRHMRSTVGWRHARPNMAQGHFHRWNGNAEHATPEHPACPAVFQGSG
jgi:hypothetical protein